MDPSAIAALLDQVSARLADSHKRLSRAEREVLTLALQGIPPSQMGSHLGKVSAAAIRKRLGEIYSKFEIKGQGPGKFEQLMEELRSLQPYSQSSAIVTPAQHHAAQLDPQLDCLIHPGSDGSDQFGGRREDIKTLASWLLNQTEAQPCQVIAIWGIAGIGKTFLMTKFLWEFKEQILRSSSDPEAEFCSVIGVYLGDGLGPLQCVRKILSQLKGTTPQDEHWFEHQESEPDSVKKTAIYKKMN
ncbi:MAG: hypothetical protein HC824_20440 [Synechococcales cyanobacterium RM1_1_8]|nr:hypothetical protein [Synechococcales cyanobacterium RM1_1_8]